MRARRANSNLFPLLMAGVGVLFVLSWVARAGGPLLVGGPGLGVEGQPFVWNVAALPVHYRVEAGSLARKPDGTVVVSNATGVARVQAAFQVWQDVPTASITFANAGTIQPTGAFMGGDVNTIEEFDAVEGSCNAGTQSPVIFDSDGTLFLQLMGDYSVIGFAGPCKLDETGGYILSAIGAFNGRFQDGIDEPYIPNYEMTVAEFNEALVHEFGHFAGLDHSQINESVLDRATALCNTTDLAGLPIMFPFATCQARSTASLPMLAPDDLAWISRLYPETVNSPPSRVPFSSKYGTIRGTILFSDGQTQAQGVNIIARDTTATRAKAVSVVSGYHFTGNFGQNVTGTNDGGSPFGSRQPLLIGAYDLPVPAASYYLEVESVREYFAGASGVGPLNPPIPSPGPAEFWNTSESSHDTTADKNAVAVSAAAVVNEINIILNGTSLRFDSFESAALWLLEPPPALPQEEEWLPRAVAS
jgi:hypothetical protein